MTFAATAFYPPSLNNGRHVFVFGSNLAGRHGAGAAFTARQRWGAVTGVGCDFTGSAYALPTKDRHLVPLTLDVIEVYVSGFKNEATYFPHQAFLVTRVGCGLAGYTDKDIAPMFKDAPGNCMLPLAWKGLLLPLTS